MTIEEAKNILINRGFVEINGDQVFDGNKWRNAITVISKWLEQQPCEDCISRQAVDELSKELVHTTRDKADFLCNFWEGLQKLPPVTPKEKTGWIPVSERLPEECSGVLVYCPENKNIFLAYLEIGKWYIFSPNADEPIDEPIVAWMPLPKPYKPQESEDKEGKNE